MLPAGSPKPTAVHAWAQRGKIFFDRLRHSLDAPLQSPPPSVWYAGLIIEPTDFSCQLSRLQVSLQGANAAPDTRKRVAASPGASAQ
jgi:hypothetical protein